MPFMWFSAQEGTSFRVFLSFPHMRLCVCLWVGVCASVCVSLSVSLCSSARHLNNVCIVIVLKRIYCPLCCGLRRCGHIWAVAGLLKCDRMRVKCGKRRPIQSTWLACSGLLARALQRFKLVSTLYLISNSIKTDSHKYTYAHPHTHLLA